MQRILLSLINIFYYTFTTYFDVFLDVIDGEKMDYRNLTKSTEFGGPENLRSISTLRSISYVRTPSRLDRLP